ncbi:MAG: hypothetical protein KGH53_02775 [Candidatus Micrarchaeota archaeon]|nr:hypothetical protein [Candidatus Micrarchaeota archaeon]
MFFQRPSKESTQMALEQKIASLLPEADKATILWASNLLSKVKERKSLETTEVRELISPRYSSDQSILSKVSSALEQADIIWLIKHKDAALRQAVAADQDIIKSLSQTKVGAMAMTVLADDPSGAVVGALSSNPMVHHVLKSYIKGERGRSELLEYIDRHSGLRLPSK